MSEAAASLTNGDHDVVNNNVNGSTLHLKAKDCGVTSGTSEWIDAALVAKAIGEDPSIIRDIAIKAAVAEGDNYCSCMWRVKALAGDRPVHLIVKAPPKGGLMQEFIFKLGAFMKEARMLKETLPAMRALATSRLGPDHILAQPLGPSTLPCSVPGVIIMEDLSVDGFRNKTRQPQLDRPHCEVALEILARLHALSVALHREDPASMDGYSEAMYIRSPESPEDEKSMRMLTEMQLQKFAGMVDVWEGTKDKQLGDPMRRLADKMFEDLCDAVLPGEDPNSINVLNHGDFWINNIMFQYDTDDTLSLRPRDVRLVDLQLVRYSSPVLDLHYFLITSAKEKVREEQMDQLLEFYHDHFNEYVTALGVEDSRWSSFDALRKEFLSKSIFGFSTVYSVLCAVVAEPEDRLLLDDITVDTMGDSDITARAWAGATYQRILPGLLDYFVKIGVLV